MKVPQPIYGCTFRAVESELLERRTGSLTPLEEIQVALEGSTVWTTLVDSSFDAFRD